MTPTRVCGYFFVLKIDFGDVRNASSDCYLAQKIHNNQWQPGVFDLRKLRIKPDD